MSSARRKPPGEAQRRLTRAASSTASIASLRLNTIQIFNLALQLLSRGFRRQVADFFIT